LRHLAPVIGPVASTPTVWRALSGVGPVRLLRLNAAVTSFRRHWWGLLAQRSQGFPWLRVAGRELTEVTVVDLDASIVFAAAEHLGSVSLTCGADDGHAAGWVRQDVRRDRLAGVSAGTPTI
jgi:hypothetical protein